MKILFLLDHFELREEIRTVGHSYLKRRKFLRGIFFTVLWLAMTFVKALFGQTIYSTSQLLQPLDNTGGSARAMAMGSAFVGVADDSSALLWNPAGLGELKQGELALHHNSWLVGTLQESLVAGMSVRDIGGIGAMVTYLDYGTFQGRDATGALTSPYTANKIGLMLGWGKELDPGFLAGVALRGSLQSDSMQSYGLISGDIGLLFPLESRLRMGVALVNFGGNQAGAWVSSAIRVGISFQPLTDSPHSLLVALGGTFELQGLNRIEVGAEYAYQSKYFLRAGYQYSGQNNEIEGFQGFTAGAGVRFQDIQLDYAYLPYGDLGTSHRISLSYFFGRGEVRGTASRPPAVQSTHPESPVGSFRPNDGTQGSQKVLTLQFDVPADLVAQGQVLDGQGRRSEATKLYLDELKQNSGDWEAWYYLGVDYDKLNQKGQAISCFEQVQKLKPDDKGFSDWLESYKYSRP